MKIELFVIGTVLMAFSVCPYWKDQLNEEDRIDDISQEDLSDLLGVEYEPNDFMEELMLQMTSDSSLFPNRNAAGSKSDCANRRDFSGPDVLQFLPQTKAIIHNTSEVINFANDCFVKNTIQMLSAEKGKVVVNINTSEPSSLICKDSYLLTTSNQFKVKIAFMKGNHLITFSDLSEDDMTEIKVNGLRVFGFCESLSETVLSVYKTIKFFYLSKTSHHQIVNGKGFFKGKTPEQVELDNVNFLKKFSNFPVEHRGKYADVVLPVEDEIQSGDFIGMTQMNSMISTIIMYTTGGRISHAAIALRLESNKLFIAEMKGTGLTISSWDDFVKEQVETQHYVIHCPLKPEFRRRFDTQKTYDYFKSLGKMQYGNHNMIFPWFDVADKATPIYIPPENILLFGSLIEKYDRMIPNELIGAGLNMRLGTVNLSMSEIAIEAAKHNMTFEELLAVPEDDNWRYENGENIVCSSFVASMYKVGGLFEGIQFNTKELQPKDLYLLNLFDKDYKDKRPQICKEADPDLPYCQLMGRYRLKLEGYSSITPYSHMFDRCPSQPPFYNLTLNC